MEQHHRVSPAQMFYIRDTNCSGMADGGKEYTLTGALHFTGTNLHVRLTTR